MQNRVLQLFRIPETRQKIFTTLGLLAAYRIGFFIPVPAISPTLVEQIRQNAGSSVFGLMSAFTGSQIGQATIFSLGIMPYISASIIFSVLGKVSPQIEAIQKEGASGQKRINQWTRLSVVPIALIQALFVWFGVLTQMPGFVAQGSSIGMMLSTVLALVAGSLFVMWIGELITEHGIGNGASIIIMAGIIATMPGSLAGLMANSPEDAWGIMLKLIFIWISIVVLIVFIQKGERRIPIQYARLARGRRVYGGPKHYLPLKVNMAGVMPIIFASALFIPPGILVEALDWQWGKQVMSDTDGFFYIVGSLALVFGFCFFWNNLMYRPDEMADNLRENGAAIPGYRPGSKTAEFLKGTLTRLTLAGAVFLALVAVLPNFITGNIPSLSPQLAYFLGGTSVLIVVGVAMDLVDKLNAQLVMRNYDGFMKTRKGSGTGLGGGIGGWAQRG